MENFNPNASYAERLKCASESRREHLQACFSGPFYALTSMMGPMNDGPDWPSNAAWLAFGHGDSAGIISDGLSDPWTNTKLSSNGLGLEVFVNSPDVVFLKDNPMAIADTWLFPMIAEISHTLAMYPRLCDKLRAGNLLSLRFNIEHIKDGRGLVGVLLHIPPKMRSLPMAQGEVSLVAATLLTTEELRWLVGKGDGGRAQLHHLLNEMGVGQLSLAHRDSVLPSSVEEV